MFEEYIVIDENAGIDAEKVVVDLAKGLTSASIDQEVLDLYVADVIKRIGGDINLNVEIKTTNIKANSTALGKITGSIEWNRSCAISANLICHELIGERRRGTVEVLHNQASGSSFLDRLRLVGNLVYSTIGGRLDRWNPADIWLVSSNSSSLLKVSGSLFSVKDDDLEKLKRSRNKLEKAKALNYLTEKFDKAFDSGDVIGVSLKKVVLSKNSYRVEEGGDVVIDSITSMPYSSNPIPSSGSIADNTNIIFSSELMFTDDVVNGGKFEVNNGNIHCTFPSSSESNGTLRIIRKPDNRVAYELDGHSTFLGSSTKFKSLPAGSAKDLLYDYLTGKASGHIEDDTVKGYIKQLVQHCVSEYSTTISGSIGGKDESVTVTSAKHYRIA